VPADTAAGRRRAASALLASLAKPTDGWFSLHLNRPLSLRLTRWLAPFGVSPDAMTLVTLLVGAASALVSALGSHAAFVWGAVLFQAASVLDGVDGELARLGFRESTRGEWLDTVSDDLTNLLYLAGVTLGVHRAFGSVPLVAAGVAAMMLDIAIVGFLYWRVVARLGGRSLLAFQGELDRPELLANRWGRLLRLGQRLLKRDAYGFAFLLFAILGVPWLTLVGTALGLAVGLPAVIVLEVRALRRAAVLDSPAGPA
jgi:CDP-L-myo-inositol myo-inositolphosphotransferase